MKPKTLMNLLWVLGTISSCHMEVPPLPRADFSTDRIECEAPCNISFTSTSENAETFEWDFDDGSGLVKGAQVSHLFKSGRNYYIKMVATSKNGGSHAVTKTIHIKEEPESVPIASFYYQPASGIYTGTEVTFVNQSHNSERYLWNFGDQDSGAGNTSSSERPVHKFSHSGTFQVKLTAFNSKGTPDDTTVAVKVQARQVTAAFDVVGGENCAAPCTVSFTNKSENATSYTWTIDNGFSSQQKDPGQVTLEKGTYKITLVATGEGGSDTAVHEITVRGTLLDAIAITATGNSWGNDIISDAAGNLLACGFVKGDVNFGNGHTASTNSGSEDLFLAKYGKDGSCQWANVIGGSGWDEAHKVTVDNTGDVYIVGETDGKASAAPASEAGAFGQRDGFVAKFRGTDGTLLWFRTIGGAFNDAALGIAYSSSNNRIYVSGRIRGANVNFNGILHNADGDDAFLVFVVPETGEVRQPTIVGGPNDQSSNAVTVDADGNAYLTGFFINWMRFPASHQVPELASSGGADVFVAKWILKDGKWLWAAKAGSSGNEYGDDIVIDASLSAYVTGTHSNGYLMELGVGSGGDDNAFIGKWGPDGTYVIWGRNGLNDGATDYAGSIARSADQSIIVQGSYTSSGQFPFNDGRIIQSSGDKDVFVAEIKNTDGYQTGLGIKSGGGKGEDRGKGICVTPDGSVYGIGSFKGTATFNNVNLVSKAGNDFNIFITKWK